MPELFAQIVTKEGDSSSDQRAIDAALTLVLLGRVDIFFDGQHVRLEPVRGQRGVTVGRITHFDVVRIED